MNLPATLLFLFLSLSLHAQTFQKIKVSGTVKSTVPVHAADCYLKHNEHLGAMTDTLGYFQFQISEALLYDTLVISAMGCERKEIPLSFIAARQDTLIFHLDPRPILLQEILIQSTGLDLKNLVLKAIARIPDNYPNRRHQMTGLYRKISTEGDEYTHLEEATCLIEDNGYATPAESARIKTLHYRQTNDWGDFDSLFATAADNMNRKISSTLNTSANPLNRVYEGSSPVRHYRTEGTYFNFRYMRKVIEDHYTFDLMAISVVDGDTIYQIAFAESVTPPPPEQASGRTYLMINGADFGIIEVQFTTGFPDQPLMSQKQVKFEKKNGKYYPKYIRHITPRTINKNSQDDEFDIHTFWFDHVVTTKLEKIREFEVNDRRDPESHKRHTFSPGFWDSSLLIKKYPLERAVRTDLEKHGALEEQFRQNAEN